MNIIADNVLRATPKNLADTVVFGEDTPADYFRDLLLGQVAAEATAQDGAAPDEQQKEDDGAHTVPTDAAVASSVQGRIKQPCDVEVLTTPLTSSLTAAQIGEAFTDRLQAILGKNAQVSIEPALFERMAADPDFAAQMNGLLDALAQHPWNTEEIPGLVSRFVHIGADGQGIFGILRNVSADEDEESAIEVLLQRMVDDMQGEMESVLFDKEEDLSKTSAQLIAEIIQQFIDRQEAAREAVPDLAPTEPEPVAL